MQNIPKTIQVGTARQFVFLQRLSMAHERIARVVSNLDTTTIYTVPIAGSWTIKDIFGHVVTWNHEFKRAIRVILENKRLHKPMSEERNIDWNEWNERKIAEKSKRAWKRIRADLDRDYTETVELILALQPDEFRASGINAWAHSPPKEMKKVLHREVESVETLIMYQWRHMNQHARMIEQWREKKAL
jgi:hypothetical protein